MAQQFELFPEPTVVVHPSATPSEPRLWVRRLALWEKPGSIIRDVSLRRGLNIIWSPDPGVDSAVVGRGDGSGHGAGKTLFCRLLSATALVKTRSPTTTFEKVWQSICQRALWESRP